MDDYLILRYDEAIKTSEASGILTWYVDKAYYSNDRGTVCDVEMVMLNASLDVTFNDCCVVETDLAVYNVYNTKNDGWNVINVLTDNVAAQRIGKLPVYRTPARPHKISVKFRSLNGTGFDLSTGDFGCFCVLKFSYDDPKKETADYIETSYKTL